MFTFVNKNDQMKLDIINLLFESSDGTQQIDDLSLTLKMSKYLIKESIISFNYDFQVMFKKIAIKTKGNRVDIDRNIVTRENIYKISNYYFINGPYARFMEYLILNAKFPNYSDIGPNNGWSASLYFRLKRKIYKYFSVKNPIHAINNIFMIYFLYYQNKIKFDNFVWEHTDNLTKYLVDHQIIKKIDKNRVQSYLSLVFIWLNNNLKIAKEHISKQEIYFDNIELELLKLGDTYSNQHNDKQIISFILLELTSFNMTNQDVMINMMTDQQYIDKKNQFKIDTFMSQLPITYCFDVTLEKNIVMDIIKYNNHKDLYVNKNFIVDVGYYEEIFPTLTFDVESYINSIIPTQINSDNTSLVFNIVSDVITRLDVSKIDEAKIGIFFSGTLLTDKMVSSLLKSHIQNDNIIISTKFKKMDICITDTIANSTVSSDISYEKLIIWKKPPTPTDWELLGSTIVNIKRKNYEKKK